jgi:hypothetical protein
LPDGSEYGEPELLGVLLAAPHLDDCEPIRPTRALCPLPQQRGFSATCRARDERYFRFRGAIEGRDKLPALNEPRSCQTRLAWTCPRCHA